MLILLKKSPVHVVATVSEAPALGQCRLFISHSVEAHLSRGDGKFHLLLHLKYSWLARFMKIHASDARGALFTVSVYENMSF